MKKNLFFLLFLLPAFYADALNVCVDFISQSQDSLKYELRVKRTLNFVKYNDFIKVEKFGNESIQVYKFEKEAFPPINNKYYAEVFFLKNTRIYIDMYSEYKDDMRTPLKLDCVMVKLNVNENNTANIFFDKETTIEIRKN